MVQTEKSNKKALEARLTAYANQNKKTKNDSKEK